MTAPDTLAHEAKTEPPKRWRIEWENSYRTAINVSCHTCHKHHYRAPGKYLSCGVYPSAEIAETIGTKIDSSNRPARDNDPRTE